MAANKNLWCFGLLKGSASPAVSPWLTESLLPFTAACYLSSFLALVLKAGEPSLGFEPTLLRGILQSLKYPSGSSASTFGSPASPVTCPPALPTSHVVLKCFLLSVHGCKASLQLVFSGLFKMISLQFCCNSRLVLRGGYCSFHLLLCQLGSLKLYIYNKKSMFWQIVCKHYV